MSDQAHRRLLDLLAGWSHYVHDCEINPMEQKDTGVSREEYEREYEAISGLYQAAGAREDMTRIDVEEFFYDHIWPILIKGAPLASTDGETK